MRLKLKCQGCGKAVTGSRKAVIHMRGLDSHNALRAQQEWDRAHEPTEPGGFRVISGAELLSYPPPARWQVHCDDCNPHKGEDGDMCGGCYWFSLDRCKTSVDLLYWTAHLMGKNWLEATNWDQFIRAAAATTGRADP